MIGTEIENQPVMAGRPLVSVALATYNGGKYLRAQLDSIYDQSWTDLEVVASDDASTDDTVSILEEYRHRFGLEYEVNGKNVGLVKNFEKAISRCRGDFIALADQDDVWLPDKLENLFAAIGGASLVYSDAYLVDRDGHRLPGTLIENSGVKPVAGNAFEYFVCNTCVTGCTVLFRRNLLETALPVPVCETYHDWWLAVVASRHNGVVYLPTPLVNYRQHGGNDTGANVKTPLLKRLAAHLTGRTEREKRRYYELLRDRASAYLAMSSRLRLSEKEIAFLHDLACYADSLLDCRFRIDSFRLALRHRAILFPAAGPLEKWVFIFSKLVNKGLIG